jgi:menaquinone-dependent protoporphyrinogen oxidase
MLPILIAYGTTEGHSRKVAEFIAERLRIRGQSVDLVDVASPAAQQVQLIYRGAILGGSLHHYKHQSALASFLKTNQTWLNAMPLGFFSVSLSAALPSEEDRAEARQAAESFVAENGLQPVTLACVAGALNYDDLDYFRRLMARQIVKKIGPGNDLSSEHEYTDWVQVEVFVDNYLRDAGISA